MSLPNAYHATATGMNEEGSTIFAFWLMSSHTRFSLKCCWTTPPHITVIPGKSKTGCNFKIRRGGLGGLGGLNFSIFEATEGSTIFSFWLMSSHATQFSLKCCRTTAPQITVIPWKSRTGCKFEIRRGGPEGPEGPGSLNFEATKTKCVLNKHIIMVCAEVDEILGPQHLLEGCHVSSKKPFKGPRRRWGRCWRNGRQ